MLPKVSGKTNQQKCLKLKTPSSQRCHITKKERSLILVAKGLHVLPGKSWIDLNKPTKIKKTFFFNRKLPSDTFLRKRFIPVLSMHLKKRGTHGSLPVITLFIFESKLCKRPHPWFEKATKKGCLFAEMKLLIKHFGWSISTAITRVQAFFLKKHIIVSLCSHYFLGTFLAAFAIFGTPL